MGKRRRNHNGQPANIVLKMQSWKKRHHAVTKRGVRICNFNMNYLNVVDLSEFINANFTMRAYVSC